MNIRLLGVYFSHVSMILLLLGCSHINTHSVPSNAPGIPQANPNHYNNVGQGFPILNPKAYFSRAYSPEQEWRLPPRH